MIVNGMQIRITSVVVLLGLTFAVGSSLAQPGGRQPRPTPAGGGSGRATAAIPVVPTQALTSSQSRPSGTPAAPQGGATRAFPRATGTRTLPGLTETPSDLPAVTGTRTLPNMTGVPAGFTPGVNVTMTPPQSLDDFSQYLQDTYDISISDKLPSSSSDAAAVLTSFAGQYLGISPGMIYAAEGDLSSVDGTQLSTLIAALPDDVQALVEAALASVDVVYGGLYQDGVAALYTGTCSGTSCSTTQGQIQFVLQEGGLGVYGTYTNGVVSDASTALSLVRQTFPALNSISLTASTSSTSGYSFIGQSTTQANRTAAVTAYYVGTYSAGQYTLVYALVGVGEGYVEMVQP